MTIRSCFYPLLGDHATGLFGDFIDAISIATTTFGVCTSLGLGVSQLSRGLKFVMRIGCDPRTKCEDKNGVWRTDTYALQRELLPDDDGRAGGILAITMDATRNLLLAGSYDASIYVWSLPHFELLHVLRGHRSAVRSLIVHGDFILSGSYDRSVKLWDLNQECSCAGSLGTRGSVWAMVVLEGLLVGAVGDSSIKVWRMDTWDLITTLSGHRGLVLALAVYKDRLISGSDDRCIRVWRAGSWECERVLTGHDGGVVGICFVQGNLISASNDSFIKIWNSSGNPRPFTAK